MNRPQPLKYINGLLIFLEPWQIVSVTASSVLFLVWIHKNMNARESFSTRVKKEFYLWMRRVPLVRRKIEEKMNEIENDFKKDVNKRLAGVTVRRELPKVGLTAEQVAEEVGNHLGLGSFEWQAGRVSGAVYHCDAGIADVACKAYSRAAYTNPLHADVFPGVNKMEAEIVRMALGLFHGDDDCCGTVTTGGTESILMACKAFRDLARARGVAHPQLVLPSTAHTAFDKAAQFLGLAVVVVPVHPRTLTADVAAMRRAVGRRTCLLVGSAPNYPYGTMDDIRALSALALERGVPLHVDACLGGFVAAFMPGAGHAVPDFDFSLPGVSSLSADTHKFGFAPKGTSVVLYRRKEFRHQQYTVSTDWPGGVYGSPTVNGSRAGGLIAACWATMLHVGRERYERMTDEIIRTARLIERELRQIEGIAVFGRPATSVVAFRSERFDVFKLSEKLHARGWSLNALQFPSGLHICVTHAHTREGVAEAFIEAVRVAAAECLAEGAAPVQGKVFCENVVITRFEPAHIYELHNAARLYQAAMAIYGVSQEISDRSLVSDITKLFIDSTYLLPEPTEES